MEEPAVSNKNNEAIRSEARLQIIPLNLEPLINNQPDETVGYFCLVRSAETHVWRGWVVVCFPRN